MDCFSKKIACLLFCVILLCFSCEREDTVPYTKVNFSVSINRSNLIHGGGHEYFTGGVCGVVVYRVDMSIFYAYDRACPYDWREEGYVIYDPAACELVCQECGSAFNILDGSPKGDSKAKTFLRSYRAVLVDDIILYVSNW